MRTTASRQRRQVPRAVPSLVALAAYLATLSHLTLVAFPAPGVRGNFVPLATVVADLTGDGRGFLVNFCGNLVGFMPFGFLLPALLGKRVTLRTVSLASLGLSLLIEGAQWGLGTRVADVDDLILNTIGGGMGFGLFAWMSNHARSIGDQ